MFRRVIASTRRARFNNVAKVPKRNMGGGEAPVPTEGVEGAIRKVLPKNEHVALAIIGGYFSLYLLSSLMSGKKKEVPAAAAASGSTADGEIPSVDSPEFSTWLATDGNIEKACTNCQ